VGTGCPLPTEEGVWGGGLCPLPRNLKKILVQCVQKIFVFRPGGASPSASPLNTPLGEPHDHESVGGLEPLGPIGVYAYVTFQLGNSVGSEV